MQITDKITDKACILRSLHVVQPTPYIHAIATPHIEPTMATQTLGETYLRYKSDTTDSVTWISNTAIIYGYQLPDSNTTAPDRYIITCKELKKQAKFLVQRSVSGLSVPVNIQTSLYGAIEARKLCSTWYLKNAGKGKETQESNSNHASFTRILEDIFRMLLPFFEVAPVSNKKKRKGTGKSDAEAVPDVNPQLKALRNRFQLVSIEEDDITELADPEPATEEKIEKPSISKSDTKQKYEMENQSDGCIFRIYCFLRDAKTLRNYLESLWKEVNQGKLHASAASVVTNVILETLKQEETNLITHLKAESDFKDVVQDPTRRNDVYLHVLDQVFPGSSRGTNEEVLENAEDTVYYSTFRTMQYFAEILSTRNASLEPDPEFNKQPKKRNLRPGEYWKRASPKLEAEDSLLCQLIHGAWFKYMDDEHQAIYSYAQHAGWFSKAGPWNLHCTIEDSIDRTLGTLIFRKNEKLIHFAMVFGARITIDIHNILGENTSDTYRQLRIRAAIVKRSLGASWVEGGPSTTISFPDCCESSEIQKWDVTDTVRCKVAQNSMVHWKNECIDCGLEHQQAPNEVADEYCVVGDENCIVPSSESDFRFQHDPVAPGLQNLKLMLLASEYGMHCANCSFVVPVIVHIYNAPKKLGYLDETWKLMDQIIEANINRLFHGNLPDTRELIKKRFLLLVGVPASELRRIGDNFKFDFSKKEAFSLPEIAKATKEYLSNDTWLLIEEGFLHNSQRLWRKSHVKKKEGDTKLDMLRHLKENMSDLVNISQLDYIGLYHVCYRILEAIAVGLYNSLAWDTYPTPMTEEERGRVLTDISRLLIFTDSENERARVDGLIIAAKVMRAACHEQSEIADPEPLKVEVGTGDYEFTTKDQKAADRLEEFKRRVKEGTVNKKRK